jgi:uncharacterized membrane protein YccF (DUF307 family)
MSDSSQGAGWWVASDGKWYPPQQAPAPATYVVVQQQPTPATYVVMRQQKGGTLQVVGNVLWFVLAGFWLALGYVFSAILQAITIIGIPFAVQSLKLAGYALWPFGRVVVKRQGGDVALQGIGNFLWFILSGLWLAIAHVVVGLLLFLPIVTIPFGIASFKMAYLALFPLGKDLVPVSDLERVYHEPVAYPA